MNRSRQARKRERVRVAMSVTPVMSSRVPWSERSMTASDGQQAAREDVGLDPVRAAELRLVGDVREGDRLEAHPATGSKRAIAGLEERREVLRADRLEHLDRDDGVVRAVDLAVVAELDVDEILEAGRADAVASPGRCCSSRDRDRRHPTAELARRVQGEAAPTGADLEHVLSAGQSGALGDDPVLVRAARRRATGPASRTPRSSRSASRRGRADRSRCRGRSGPRCCAGSRSCCGGADARGSARAGAGRGTSRRRAPAPPGSAPPGEAAPARSGLDQRPSMYASPPPVSPPTSIRTSASRSWMWISAASVDAGSPKTRARPVGQHDRQAARRGSARAAARLDPPGGPLRPGPSRDRGVAVAAVSEAASSSGAASRCRWNAGAAPPQPQRVPVDERDRLLGDERVADEHPQEGAVGQGPAHEVQARVEEQALRPAPR